MKNKRLTFLCIVLLVVATLAAPTVCAEEHDGLRQDIIESCIGGESINITGYQVTEAQLEELFFDLRDSGQLPWYAARYYNYTYIEGVSYISSFTPAVLPEDTYDRTLYEQKITEILDSVILDGMSQWQMALTVHDYLAANCVYDEALTHTSGYDAIVLGTAVCSGYADAYLDIMTRLGIECRYIVSEEMNHAWNLVKLNGNWYHVDVTWDDPAPDIYGYVDHSHFLLSDAQIMALEHFGWETDITCTDESFAGAFWEGINSQICYSEAITGYLRREVDWTGYICCRDELTGEETTLYTEDTDYIDIGYGSYAYSHQGLSLWNDRLYFSTMEEVLSCTLDGSDLRTEFSYDTAGNGKYIYSSFVTDGTIYLALSDHEYNCTTLEVPLDTTDYHTHSYETVVTPATCLDGGITTHTCSCGLAFETDPTPATGHDYRETLRSDATLFEDGVVFYACEGCGDTDSETLPRIAAADWIFDEGNWKGLAVIALCAYGVFSLISKATKKARKKYKSQFIGQFMPPL